jgi:hypothetical protein
MSSSLIDAVRPHPTADLAVPTSLRRAAAGSAAGSRETPTLRGVGGGPGDLQQTQYPRSRRNAGLAGPLGLLGRSVVIANEVAGDRPNASVRPRPPRPGRCESSPAGRPIRLLLRAGAPVGNPFTGRTGAVNAVAVGQLDGRAIIASGSLRSPTSRARHTRRGDRAWPHKRALPTQMSGIRRL